MDELLKLLWFAFMVIFIVVVLGVIILLAVSALSLVWSGLYYVFPFLWMPS